MTSDDRWTDMTTFDEELDALLSGTAPAPEAPAWCSDVAVLVRTLQAPARPGELAGEADIVARMRELLTLPIDDGDDASGAGEDDVPRIAAVAVEPAEAGEPTDVDDAADDEDVDPLDASPGLLRSRMGLTDLDDYRAKHGERTYIAKHAAARLEASRYPVARTVGRVVAMKAAAVTTAVVIGVAAAAAATTGIVATVVVPAINDHVRRPPVVSQAPADKDDDAGTTRGEGRSGGGRDGDDSPSATCSNVLIMCPPAVSVPADPGTPTPAPGSSTATTAPATTSTTSSTTSTTSTTEPEPPTTPTTTPTTEPPPTTEPQPTPLESGGG